MLVALLFIIVIYKYKDFQWSNIAMQFVNKCKGFTITIWAIGLYLDFIREMGCNYVI